MSKSLFFNEEDIVESSEYNPAVNPDVFLKKIEDICVYEQEYTDNKVVDLEQAEDILLYIRQLYKRK